VKNVLLMLVEWGSSYMACLLLPHVLMLLW
jgi:hypothetical protein